MSGFEIAGVVLGSIPLVIAALDCYMRGVGTIQSFRAYKRGLKRLIQALETEHVNLQNVYERLLVGIAPSYHIEAMIEDPFGEQWRETEVLSKLRLRLWRSFKNFEDTVHDMREAVQEMMEKLGIGPDGKVKWIEHTSIKRQYKRVSFILQRSNYDDLLTRIREGVSSLQNMAIMNVNMESHRTLRSRVRLSQLVNATSNSVYRALRSTITCRCQRLHDVGLRLTPPSRTIIPQDEDDDVIKELQFRLIVSHMGPLENPSVSQWSEILLQSTRSQAREQSTPHLATKSSSSKKSVKFSMRSSFSSTSTASRSTQTSAIVQPAMATLSLGSTLMPMDTRTPRQIHDLCETMQTTGKRKSGDSYGYIQDRLSPKPKEYGVYFTDYLGDCESHALVPLKDVLRDQSNGSLSPMLYNDKLRLAWMIACGFLQMQDTPWIPSCPTHDDIYVVQKGGVPQYQNAFVLKHLPDRAGQGSINISTTSSARPTLLSLGIILIELVLGKPLESLQPKDTPASQLSPNYEAANKFLGRVNMLGGPGYFSAVQRCISPMPQSSKKEGDLEFQSNVFARIVVPLEQDFRNSIV
ncbi:hypothetical protein NM208_g6521 [Fusarium decemcellulare]|uniref:Uncharacterized protein n=1 Tax=Fusarium decemcellulare TaxID=57161 RepID=A0ACC1SCP6_9HYPO|nr:hypothetical protein NM208_g6521 [Fusarium decemcellulare]